MCDLLTSFLLPTHSGFLCIFNFHFPRRLILQPIRRQDRVSQSAHGSILVQCVDCGTDQAGQIERQQQKIWTFFSNRVRKVIKVYQSTECEEEGSKQEFFRLRRWMVPAVGLGLPKLREPEPVRTGVGGSAWWAEQLACRRWPSGSTYRCIWTEICCRDQHVFAGYASRRD